MLTFIIRRVLIGFGILLVSSFLLYLLVDLTIDPLEDLAQSTATNKEFLIAERIRLLELDKPVIQRYIEWIGGVFTGDLGTAWRTNRPVGELLQGAIISTLQLVSASTVLSIVLGVAVGIVSALRQYSGFDYLITFVSFLLFSLPSFWVAVLLKQWGAIGFNDFLANAWIAWGIVIGLGVIAGFLWQLAIGGAVKRRLINGAIGAAATIGALAFLQLSGWWEKPNIGPVILAVTSVVIAFAVTALSTGLKNRRALYTALTCAVLGVALWYPIRFYLFYYLTPYMNWLVVLGLAVLAVAVGIAIGVLFRGPDWKQSARTGGIVAFLVAGLIFIDQVMSVWGPYYNSNAINGRPIPTIGDRTPNLGGNWWVGLLDSYTHLLLPTLALMLISFAGYTRYSRGSMLEVMNQDYIRTARAKGLTERTVVVRHGFRNSLIPLATIVPLDVITLIGGAIITERIFGRPGMGQLFLQSLDGAEIEPVMAYLLIVSFLAIVANIVADLIYAVLDPRIRVNA